MMTGTSTIRESELRSCRTDSRLMFHSEKEDMKPLISMTSRLPSGTKEKQSSKTTADQIMSSGELKK